MNVKCVSQMNWLTYLHVLFLTGVKNNSYGHPAAAAAKLLQLCPTLCDPMDCSLQGSSVHGIFQARVLEWGAIAFSETKVLVRANLNTDLHTHR